jgi:ferredoxin
MAEKTDHNSAASNPNRAFIRQAKSRPDYSLSTLLHGLIYSNWPYLYIALGKGDHPIAKALAPIIEIWQRIFPAPPKSVMPDHSVNSPSRTFADEYHGKVLPLDQARQLISVNEPINLPDLEHIVPYVKARSIILENPDHIIALDCPCRAGQTDHCHPLKVCLVIGEPFTSQILQRYPEQSESITQEEAVRIIEEEDQRGHVHHAFFKDAMLGRFYAICNCCDCCCGAIKAHKNNVPMLASSGYIARVNPDLCQNCGLCVEYCQFNALIEHKDHVAPQASLCMGCGVCVNQCAFNALELVRDESKGEPLEIMALMAQAAHEQP